MATELRQTYDGTLEALVSALDARDRETKGHSIRVARYMMEIAFHMGIQPSTEEWVDMQRGALLHDVGKIGIPDHILRKPGKLTAEEYAIVQQHVVLGDMIVRDLPDIDLIRAGVRHHHERWDGAGYPTRRAGSAIPLEGRVLAVADAFDAMTSDRPYRRALSRAEALAEVERCSGTQFDPEIARVFLELFAGAELPAAAAS